MRHQTIEQLVNRRVLADLGTAEPVTGLVIKDKDGEYFLLHDNCERMGGNPHTGTNRRGYQYSWWLQGDCGRDYISLTPLDCDERLGTIL